MENKYYTPEIEEFHVGFEYEEDDSEWSKRTFESYMDLEILNDDIREGNIRVKILNKEDIESLGWELICPAKSKNSCSLYQWNKAYDYEGSDLEIRWHISHYSDNKLIIHNNQYYDSEVVIFSGTIKNKSELKKLTQQLNIK